MMIPSGKRFRNELENHHFSWVNPLFRLGHVHLHGPVRLLSRFSGIGNIYSREGREPWHSALQGGDTRFETAMVSHG